MTSKVIYGNQQSKEWHIGPLRTCRTVLSIAYCSCGYYTACSDGRKGEPVACGGQRVSVWCLQVHPVVSAWWSCVCPVFGQTADHLCLPACLVKYSWPTVLGKGVVETGSSECCLPGEQMYEECARWLWNSRERSRRSGATNDAIFG